MLANKFKNTKITLGFSHHLPFSPFFFSDDDKKEKAKKGEETRTGHRLDDLYEGARGRGCMNVNYMENTTVDYVFR